MGGATYAVKKLSVMREILDKVSGQPSPVIQSW